MNAVPTNRLESLLPHDDPIARNAGHNQRVLNLQKEWLFRNEQSETNPRQVQLGMPVPSQEHWNNALLGRFVVIREQVGGDSVGLKHSRAPWKFLSRFYPKRSGRGSSSEWTTGTMRKETLTGELTETKLSGAMYESKTSRKSSKSKPNTQTPTMSARTHRTSGNETGKPPQQRLVIRKMDLRHPEPEDQLSSRPEQVDQSRLPLHPLGYDPLHPAVIVHKHSKVSAFSLSRHHRSSWATRGNPPSPHRSTTVIMLAQRNVQEAFMNTETTKRLAQAMSSMNSDRDKEDIDEKGSSTKSSAKIRSSTTAFEAKGLGDGKFNDSPTEKPSLRGALRAAFSEIVACSSRSNPAVDDETNINLILIAQKLRVDQHKGYGAKCVLDLLQYSQTTLRSCRIFHSNISKRLSFKPRDRASISKSSNTPLPKRQQQGMDRIASEWQVEVCCPT
ncbi:hypothetical protein PQX77_001416 [Marasmius sp. AFHP31]|nr:hypothetical protein PQX77_001416 [Marasmius sp. AFHP31]